MWGVAALPPDYDIDPARVRSGDRAWQVFGDVHEPVAARIQAESLAPVLDVGGGQGRLEELLPEKWPAFILDPSPTQLADAPYAKARTDARRLTIRDSSAGAVTMLWMLYHLEDPVIAIAEAHRVLRPRGLFAASTSSRDNDPELTDGYPPTPFDAEEAVEIVSSVFDDVAVERWDGPMTRLPDQEAVLRYCRSHSLFPEAAKRVRPPVWLTKRGCLVYAYKR